MLETGQILQQSTAVEQAVALRLSRSGPGFDPRSGRVSWVRFFSEFFFICKTNVGKIQAQEVLEYHLAVIMILLYSFVRTNGCVNGVCRLSCSYCLGGGPGIELITNPGDPPCLFVVKKYVCDPEVIPSPDSCGFVRPGWHESRKSICKGDVKLR